MPTIDTVDGWLGATLLVIGFLVLCRLLRLLESAQQVLHIANEAFAVMGNPLLDEDTKERAMQRHALTLFKLFLLLVTGLAVALLLPMAIIWLAEQVGWLSLQSALAVGLSWRFIVLISVLSVLLWWGWRHWRRGAATPTSQVNEYSATNRLLHRTAFASVPLQLALGAFEQRLYRRRLSDIVVERPVFVAGLPRSGTTLLLELCYQTGEFATHTYRQMPFVLNPLLWETLSRRSQKNAPLQERAHGDGIMISSDSPEAFEEMLWLASWPEHYQAESVKPWLSTEKADDFPARFRSHMKKMLALHTTSTASKRRYLSKNNLNIARTGWLLEHFPDARIIVPFREPTEHAASLLRQHKNFLARHRDDPFTLEYMTAIGHFDFGENLRPINFNDWLATAAELDPTTLDFWLAYWVAAYQALYQQAAEDERVLLLDFDALCDGPEAGLAAIGTFVGLTNPAALTEQAPRLHPPAGHAVDESQLSANRLQEALTLHATMRSLH